MTTTSQKSITVLSLFDGVSCGQIALQVAGFKVEKYYAAEIDKHAMQVTQHNFPNTIQLGDVTKWRDWDIDWWSIDLVLAGSPCQGFSFAGKQLAFDDPRSQLFFVFVDILNHIKKLNTKVHYLLENVKMKKEHELVISKMLGVAPIVINSAFVSAQNRERNYWTNIYNQPQGLFGYMQCMIPQPKDKGVLLKDVLETNVPDKYYLSEKMLQYFSNRAANFNQGKVNVREEEGKASCLTSSMASCDISDNFIKVDTNLKKSTNQDKANCFTAGGNSGGLHSDMTLICIDSNNRINSEKTGTIDSNYHKSPENFGSRPFIVSSRGRNPENPTSRKKGLKLEQTLEPRFDNKTNCLTSVQKDNMVIHQRGRGFNKGGEHTEKSPLLTSNSWDWNNTLKLRRLTPTECKRLQTVPDWYDMSIISDTQQYRMLGNGWTIDVIAHILFFLSFN
jgi:DNA (cytosine-5)-methyltransferase 3A